MVFYFSGTGNSRWVAETLAARLDDKAVSVTDVDGDDAWLEIRKDERLGFVFPVYAWGMPEYFESFINKMRVKNVGYVYFVCTCGDDTGKTREQFISVAGRKGWKVSSGYSVRMPNTYVCLPGFDVDKPELERAKREDAERRVEWIAGQVMSCVDGEFDVFPGAVPWLKSRVVRPLFNKLLITSRPFRVTDKCVECGKCANVCPAKNIRMRKRPVWDDKCLGCLRCYHSCPVNAVQFGPFTKGKGQYLFEK